MNFLAPKLIQHVIAIGSIKNLYTGLYFAHLLVNFLAPKLIQYVMAIKEVCNGGLACSLLKLGSLEKTVKIA